MPPCGRKDSAARWGSACSMILPGTTTTLWADSIRTRSSRRRRVTRAGGRAWALACGKSPTAASACSWTAAATTCMSTTTWRTAADTGSAWGWPATSAETTDASAAPKTSSTEEKRTEPVFQRYACGWGCHYALGFCFDDAGDDTYGGTIMGLGFAWDMSVGVLCDFAGNDRYEAARQHTQGCGAQAGLGILFDYEGNDVYLGQGQGYASPSISYHSQSACGGNFSFLVDYGGKDEYGCGVENNSYNQRGSAGGFVIDRPKQEELEKTVEGKKRKRRRSRDLAARM